MNENRGVFSIHGVTGMLIATAILLACLVYLSVNAMSVQNENASNFYELKDPQSIQMRSIDNAKHVVDVK